ncbi:hypothetical protein H0H92_015523 [Tricholoma furcatifolium]|nr:hypothetical protein H0H92_015523 [Tricholoma furcatifolium]
MPTIFLTPELGGDSTQGMSTVEVGKVIKCLASLHELLRCLRDFVPDHKSAHNKLYLQRNISIKNLLILEGAADETFGRLVDYDQAKKAAVLIDIARPGEKLKNMALYADMASTLLAHESDSRWQVEAAVALEAVACVACPTEGGTYLFDVIKNDPSLAEKAATRPLSMDDLHWTEAGTLPSMSAEVIKGKSIIRPFGYKSTPTFTHQAIHDMESLFWVLIFLCMTRKGPGMGMRRDELNVTNLDINLSRAVNQYFDGDETAVLSGKEDLLGQLELIEEEIIKYFHPYFDGLKPLVRNWWNILTLAYNYRAKEFYNIHAYLLRIIDKAIASLPQDTNHTFKPEST